MPFMSISQVQRTPTSNGDEEVFSPDDSDIDPDYAVSENEDDAGGSAAPEIDETAPEPEPDTARKEVVPTICDDSDEEDLSVDGDFNNNDINHDEEEYTCVWSDPTADFLPPFFLPGPIILSWGISISKTNILELTCFPLMSNA